MLPSSIIQKKQFCLLVLSLPALLHCLATGYLTINESVPNAIDLSNLTYTPPPARYPDMLDSIPDTLILDGKPLEFNNTSGEYNNKPFDAPNNTNIPIPFTIELEKLPQKTGNSKSSICNPEDFADVLARVLNIYCLIPQYCGSYIANLAKNASDFAENAITAENILWRWYPKGSNRLFIRIMARVPMNNNNNDINDTINYYYLPTQTIQNVVSKTREILEARVKCKVMNPLPTFYTYAFWVMPLLAGSLFLTLLGCVILIYRTWSPGIEQNLTYKLLGKGELLIDEGIQTIDRNKSSAGFN